MVEAEIKQLIKRELPVMFREDVEIHQFIIELSNERFADKRDTESRFDQVLAELRRDREANEKRWNEHLQETQQLQEEQNRKWEQNQKNIQQVLDRLDAFTRKYESNIGAIGSRWGFQAEEAFRSALKSILEESFGVEVLNITEFDDTGEVFGRPDQVELDVIIKNGVLIICEIKSSMSRGDVYIFDRKVAFYERLHQCQATRRIIITPMMRDDARRVAAKLDIEVFGDADQVRP